MNGLTSGQHIDKLVNASRASFGFLGDSNPIEDGVPIRTGECLKHRLRAGIGIESNEKILRHFTVRLSGVGGLPSTVLFCLAHLVLARSMHSADGDHPFGDGSVPLRPRATNFSRRETSSERSSIATPYLTINPAEADRLVKCLIIRDGRRISRSLSGQYQPHAG